MKGDTMINAEARVRIPIPRQADGELLIKDCREDRVPNAQRERSEERNRADATLLNAFDHFLSWIGRMLFARSLLPVCLALMLVCLPTISPAQPVALTPPQLDQLVARIALYPDPLLAQVLT